MLGSAMFPKRMIAALVFVSLLPLIGFAVVWQLEESPLHPTLSHSAWEDGGVGGTIGKRRHALVDELTRDYLKGNPQADVLTIDGRQIAPLQYLNRELEKREASWRVEIVDGELDFMEVV
jgi:hypothetical protein